MSAVFLSGCVRLQQPPQVRLNPNVDWALADFCHMCSHSAYALICMHNINIKAHYIKKHTRNKCGTLLMLLLFLSFTSSYPYWYELWVIFQTRPSEICTPSALSGSPLEAPRRLDELCIWTAFGTRRLPENGTVRESDPIPQMSSCELKKILHLFSLTVKYMSHTAKNGGILSKLVLFNI